MININTIKRNAGYTIDQTILIVAIIAILITIIIATVGWDLINRAGGAKLAAQFRQIEDSIGLFYASHNQWPHESLDIAVPATGAILATADAAKVAMALTGLDITAFNASIDTADVRNHVPGFQVSTPATPATAVLQHDFGGNNVQDVRLQIMQPPATTGLGTGADPSPYFLVVRFSNVPAPEAHEADEAIDGSVDAVVGRVWYDGDCTDGGTAGHTTSTAVKDICYAANLIQ